MPRLDLMTPPEHVETIIKSKTEGVEQLGKFLSQKNSVNDTGLRFSHSLILILFVGEEKGGRGGRSAGRLTNQESHCFTGNK